VQPLPGEAEAIFTDFNDVPQGVGYSRIFNFVTSQPFIWDLNGIRPFPIPDVVGPLAINSAGVIVGTQRLGAGFQVFSLHGSDYRQLPTPSASYVAVAEVTDSGIVHLRAGENAFSASNAWAIYNSQLYDLRPLGFIYAIGEDGTVAGVRNNIPFLRSLDGREVMPWAGPVAITLGAGGHFAATANAAQVFFGEPSGAMTTFVPQVNLSTPFFSEMRSINRRGDAIGRDRNIRGSCSPQAFAVFLYKNGQTIDLTRAVPLSRGQLVDALRITDGGVIAATAAIGALSGGLVNRQVVLLPDDGAVLEPPRGLVFTVDGLAVTLQWQHSAGADDYIVQAGSAPGQTDFYNQAVGPHPVVAGVVPKGRYFVRVLARRGLLTSAPSEEIVIDVQ
jgi:hypothetical protein